GPFEALQAAKQSTSRVPIIMTPSADPVVAGIVVLREREHWLCSCTLLHMLTKKFCTRPTIFAQGSDYDIPHQLSSQRRVSTYINRVCRFRRNMTGFTVCFVIS